MAQHQQQQQVTRIFNNKECMYCAKTLMINVTPKLIFKLIKSFKSCGKCLRICCLDCEKKHFRDVIRVLGDEKIEALMKKNNGKKIYTKKRYCSDCIMKKRKIFII